VFRRTLSNLKFNWPVSSSFTRCSYQIPFNEYFHSGNIHEALEVISQEEEPTAISA
jgi:hypothetical protein